jgi:hypothetical protein
MKLFGHSTVRLEPNELDCLLSPLHFFFVYFAAVVFTNVNTALDIQSTRYKN